MGKARREKLLPDVQTEYLPCACLPGQELFNCIVEAVVKVRNWVTSETDILAEKGGVVLDLPTREVVQMTARRN